MMNRIVESKWTYLILFIAVMTAMYWTAYNG